MNEKIKGGRRVNAGRKKADDPKQTLCLYLKTSTIVTFGTKELLQNKLYTYIEQEKKNLDNIIGEKISHSSSITTTYRLTPEELTEKYSTENNPMPTWDRTKESWIQYKERLTAWSNKK